MFDDEAKSLLGHCIGPYEVTERIGRGGMGEVFLAQDSRLARKVALKLLRFDVTQDKQRLERFKQEARAASALNHPNILTIYEIGEAGGRPFIATEFIEGETLRSRVENSQIGPVEAMDVAIQMASGLNAAHEAGIVHRDIKPENIMLRRDGYVKILDFGLAKLVERPAAGPEVSTLVKTEEGVIMGTARYMSPEQARGQAVDARTDIWSLGVVLYEMLSGRTPFEGETPGDVIVSILEREPVPLARYIEIVPSELERIVRKALRKSRDERYQSIKDLLLDLKSLKQHLEFEAELERSAPPSEPAATRVKPLRGRSADAKALPLEGDTPRLLLKAQLLWKSPAYLYGSVATLLVLVFMTLYLSLRSKPGSIESKSVAVLPFVNMSADKEDEYFSDGLTEELINALTKVEGLRVPARTSAFAFKATHGDIRKIGEQLNVGTVLEGSVRKAGNKLRITAQLINVADGFHLWSETYDRDMQDVFAIQDDISQRIVDALKIKLTGDQTVRFTKRYTENTEAYQSYLKGRYYWSKRNEEGLKKALEFFKQSLDQDPTFALAYLGMADDYLIMGGELHVLAASEARPLAKAAALKALELDPNLGEVHASLGLWYYHQWDWTTAQKEFERALELVPNYAPAHHWYAHFLASQRRFDEALSHIRRAEELDPLSPNAQGSEAIILLSARRYEEALEKLNKAIPSYPDFPGLYNWRSAVLVASKRFSEGIADQERGVSLSHRTAATLGRLGYAYGRAGRKAEALEIARELEELSKVHYVSSFDRALVPLGLEDKDQALLWLQKAYEERDAMVSLYTANPWLDSVREDPRFRDLLRRMNFPGK
jgi:eukaryotic-like serine/threonine-protein kinase